MLPSLALSTFCYLCAVPAPAYAETQNAGETAFEPISFAALQSLGAPGFSGHFEGECRGTIRPTGQEDVP